MKKLMLLIICLFLITFLPISGASADLSMNLMVLDGGNYRLSWTVKEDVISIQASAKTLGWVAIGFEPTEQMKDADMIIGFFDSKGSTVIDAFSTGPIGPHPDDISLGGTNDVISSSMTQRNGWTTLSFERKLVTGDKFDHPLSGDKPIQVIWSYGTSTDLKKYHETKRGSADINFIDGSNSKVTESDKKSETAKEDAKKKPVPIGYKTYLFLHLIFIGLSFLAMVSAMLALYLFKKKSWWFMLHQSMLLLTAGCLLLGLISAVLLVGTLSSGHFQGYHKMLGLFIMITSFLFLGLSLLYSRKQNLKKVLRPYHIWTARIIVFTFLVNLVTGIKLALPFFGK